jgi:hypothetical protein
MPFDFHGAEAGPESTIFLVFRIRQEKGRNGLQGVSGIEDFAHPLVELRKDCLDGHDGIPVLADGIADFAQGNAAEQGDRTAVGEFFGEVTPEGFQLFFGQILSIPG